MTTNRSTYRILIALLFCFVQMAGMTMYGQDRPRAALKRAHALQTDSLNPVLHLQTDSIDSLNTPALMETADSLAVADSIAASNRNKMLELTASPNLAEPTSPTDSLSKEMKRKLWVPNPVKATWLALIIPGGGQIYNRKYWKLPIYYGGFVACTYALTWNTRMYKDYSQAYIDIMDSDPRTNSFLDFLPPNYDASNPAIQSQLQNTFRNKKDYYRKYRDLSIFAFVGVYLLSIIDAYVDAELSNFDISQDLSMGIGPAVIDDRQCKRTAYGVQYVLTF